MCLQVPSPARLEVTDHRVDRPASANSLEICAVGPAPTSTANDGKLVVDWSKSIILVVDDEVMVQELSAEVLRQCGYHVLVANDADQAVQILKREPAIKLLFTDVVMPGSMNGFALADWARSVRPDIRVLYTSGYSWVAADKYNGMLHGDLLKKPFRARELEAAVAGALKSQRN